MDDDRIGTIGQNEFFSLCEREPAEANAWPSPKHLMSTSTPLRTRTAWTFEPVAGTGIEQKNFKKV